MSYSGFTLKKIQNNQQYDLIIGNPYEDTQKGSIYYL